ncbi:MAG: leucine--tRNA ligase [Acidobacteria bacterium]|nr:leucine--tRNA ligase [Acidobacteriota bacterium]
MKKYDFKSIEEKWQKKWDEAGSYNVTERADKPKFYCLEMLPYPSGHLHMGHTRNYSIGDAICRFKRMHGYNVLHPIGFDSFGLPAENAALENNSNPKEWTFKNIDTMRGQFRRLGVSYDWNREVITCKPEYYKWNQWFFLKMLEKGIAYRKKGSLNWCDKCNTVLANEQVENGFCWRHNDTPVIQKELVQWYFRYSDFAEELLQGIDTLEEWPERVVTMQRNWIGKSTGSTVKFKIKGSDKNLAIFTTRIDTIFGVTFMTLAPDHPMIDELVTDNTKLAEIKKFANKVREQNAKKAYDEELEKEGMPTGITAINPFDGTEIPVWVGNFVLMDYGTGAVMAVPGHDQRDYEFAVKYGLDIKTVIVPAKGGTQSEEGKAYTEKGVLVNSGQFDGLSSYDAIDAMNKFAEQKGFGGASVDYKLKDWCLSRQRFWGTPIPVIYCDDCGTVPVPEKDLPVLLPDVNISRQEGNPLASIKEFVETACPKCGKKAKRETDTMDTFIDSSWYQLRYCDAKISEAMINRDAVNYWSPVDLYVGGIEHAVGHLMYFRWFYRRLRDLGLLDGDEPVKRLMTQGMVIKDGAKMSKSKGNVVDPNDMINKYGADTTRLFSLFASPPEKDLEWNEAGVEGLYRFAHRVWNTISAHLDIIKDAQMPDAKTELTEAEQQIRRKTHQTIKKVTSDVEERMHFNTAIAAIMELLNEVSGFDSGKNPNAGPVLREALLNMVMMLAIFAPHISEELFSMITGEEFVIDRKWPEWDDKIAAENKLTIVIQINGKLRSQIEINVGEDKDTVLKMARNDEKASSYFEGFEIVKEIYVPNKLVNFVIKQK